MRVTKFRLTPAFNHDKLDRADDIREKNIYGPQKTLRRFAWFVVQENMDVVLRKFVRNPLEFRTYAAHFRSEVICRLALIFLVFIC